MSVCMCVACGMSLWQSTLHLYDNEHVKIAQNQSLRTKNHCKLLRMPLPQQRQQQQLCVPLSLSCVCACVCPTVPATVPVPEIYSCLLLLSKVYVLPNDGDKLPLPVPSSKWRSISCYDEIWSERVKKLHQLGGSFIRKPVYQLRDCVIHELLKHFRENCSSGNLIGMNSWYPVRDKSWSVWNRNLGIG